MGDRIDLIIPPTIIYLEAIICYHFVYPLLPSLHSLLAHVHQPSLRGTFREVANSSSSIVNIFLSQVTGLFNTLALGDKFASLAYSKHMSVLLH